MKPLSGKLIKIFLYLFIVLLIAVAIVEGIIIESDLTSNEDLIKLIVKYFPF